MKQFLIDYAPYIVSFIGFLATVFVGYVKLKAEMQFIKGQLSQLMEFRSDLKKTDERVAKIKTEVIRNKFDLNNAHEKIRTIERTNHGS